MTHRSASLPPAPSPTSARTSGGAASSRATVAGSPHPSTSPSASHSHRHTPPTSLPPPARQDAAPPEVPATASASSPTSARTSGGAASSRAIPILPSSPHPPRDSLPPSTRFLSDDPIEATRHHLPHWEQTGGTTCFATFRLADSLPAGKLDELRCLRDRWLAAHPAPLSPADTEEYRIRFEETAERWLDAGHGECLLRSPAARLAVEDTLRHFDGTRCRLHAFVVMPNHVHVLFTPAADMTVGKLLHSWKSFSSKAVNAALHRTGTVWEKESWDRFIRNRCHFDNTLAYIRANPGTLPVPVYVAPSILAWLASATPAAPATAFASSPASARTSGGAASSRATVAGSCHPSASPSASHSPSHPPPPSLPPPARQDAAPPEVPATASAPSPASARTSGGAASSRATVAGSPPSSASPSASHSTRHTPPTSLPPPARQDAAPPEVPATASASSPASARTSWGAASSRAPSRSPATPNPRLQP